MHFEANTRLDAALAANEQDMIETLRRWIRVPSVRGTAEAGAPFGREVRRALDTAMQDVARLGMSPRDIDGYCMDAEIGQGEETIAVLAHLDVVPEGDGWHHEPYDGKGYPDGLSGSAIPEEARIIAVADAYDAMTSRRSYRDILPQETVRAEIAKGKGTQFDPQFADIMLKMMDEDGEYNMREQ